MYTLVSRSDHKSMVRKLTIFLVEFSLNVSSDILFNVVFFESLSAAFDRLLLHLFAHVGALDDGFGVWHSVNNQGLISCHLGFPGVIAATVPGIPERRRNVGLMSEAKGKVKEKNQPSGRARISPVKLLSHTHTAAAALNLLVRDFNRHKNYFLHFITIPCDRSS